MIDKDQFPEPYFCINSHKVHSYYADFTRRLSIPAIFNFLQEAAWSHASKHAFGWDDLIKTGCIWALARLKVNVLLRPAWGDKLAVVTWCRGVEGLFPQRDFEVYNASNEKCVVASTAWLILDASTRRPRRASAFSSHFPIYPNRFALAEPLLKDSFAYNTSACNGYFRINHSDTDMNGHVNNASYIRWMLDAFAVDFLATYELCEADISFLAEAMAGEEAGVSVQEVATNEYRAAVVRKSDSKLLAQAKLLFC